MAESVSENHDENPTAKKKKTSVRPINDQNIQNQVRWKAKMEYKYGE